MKKVTPEIWLRKSRHKDTRELFDKIVTNSIKYLPQIMIKVKVYGHVLALQPS